MDTIEKLNKLYDEAYPDGLSPEGIIVKPWGDTTSTLVLFDAGDSPFRMAPIVAVPIKTNDAEGKYAVPEDFKGVVAIHRFMFTLGCASRTNDALTFVKNFHTVLNAAVVDLGNNFGRLFPGYKVTMKHEGKSPFRMSEEFGAVVGSVYLIKE